MKFFDYKPIPIDEYKAIINRAAMYVKEHLPSKNKYSEFSQTILDAREFIEVYEKLSSYSAHQEQIDQTLQTAAATLFSLSHPSKDSITEVCDAYGLDQAHIHYADKNGLFEQVKALTVEALDKHL